MVEMRDVFLLATSYGLSIASKHHSHTRLLTWTHTKVTLCYVTRYRERSRVQRFSRKNNFDRMYETNMQY